MNLNTKNILFTGAGFTANFGGFLASEMWSLIFNHELVQEKELVKEVMKRELEDFETAIEIIQNREEYKDDEKKAIQNAVDDAYKLLDSKIIKEYDSEVSLGRLQDFINLFKLNQKGFFFTLNQDLFVERFLLGVVRLRPGISPKNLTFRSKLPLKDWEICPVPSKEMIDRNKEQFIGNMRRIMYIKLHGSQDWISSSGSGVKVIGGKKIEKIKKEPILSWYSELFENVINQNGIKMLIIGYGFKDEHINKVITKAIQQFGLKLFVISPKTQKDFFSSLVQSDSIHANQIWDGLTGYYPYYLKDLFPSGGDFSVMARDLFKKLFGINMP